MSDNKNDQLKDHSYDGIQEYDNRLPNWWLGTFIITVIFGLGYWLYYEVYSIGPSQVEEYNESVLAHQEQFKSVASANGDVDEKGIQKFITDKAVLAEIKTVYMQNCMACHGADAQGVIGPNLTDSYWIHGGTPTQIYQTISNGVLEKGMLSWKGVLTPEQIQKLTAYLLSLKGSNPANPKAAEGDLVE